MIIARHFAKTVQALISVVVASSTTRWLARLGILFFTGQSPSMIPAQDCRTFTAESGEIRTDILEIVRDLLNDHSIKPQERQLVERTIYSSVDEIILCDVFDLFLHSKHPPVELVDAIHDRFIDLGDGNPFAKAKAAAVVLKWSPEHKNVRGWIGGQLENESKTARVLAAAAIGSVGPIAQDFAARLKLLLDDTSVSVRVVAAGAMQRIERDSDYVIQTLLEALEVDGEAIVLKPQGVSTQGWNHKHFAAAYLGKTKARPKDVAIGLSELLREDDSALHLIVLTSLDEIGVAEDQVLQAIAQLRENRNKAVAGKAADVFKKLVKNKKPE